MSDANRVPAALATSAVAGALIGTMTVVFAISFSAVIFSGPLAPLLSKGIGIGLFSATVIAAVIALTASYRGTVGHPQGATAAILGLAMAGMAQGLPPAGSADLLYATVVATLALSCAAASLVLLGLGYFKLGVLVRYIPYPVVGGFLAATGWLLAKSAVGLMTGTPLDLGSLGRLLQPDVLMAWTPGLLLGLALLAGSRRTSHPAFLPGMLVAATALFYAATAVANISVAEAAQRGWLLGPFPGHGFWQAISPWSLAEADWAAVLDQLPTILTAVVLAVMGVLLNASGIELAVRQDIDLDRELRSAGVANLVAAAGGGIIGYQGLGLSVLSKRLGADTRVVGLIAAAVSAAALLVGASLFSYVPKLVFGGVIAFLGFDFLYAWLHEQRSRLPVSDYLIVVMIFLVAASVGFLEGIAVGIVAGIVLFIVSYSRISVVKHQLSGTSFRSKVDRSERQVRHLRERGDELLILELQGFIFFGTSHRLQQQVRAHVDGAGAQPRFVVVDFRHVHGVDSSAVLSFAKLHQLAEKGGFVLVLTGLSPEIRRQLERGGFPFGKDGTSAVLADLDKGVEWCEDRILHADAVDLAPKAVPLESVLRHEFPQHAGAERLLDYFDRHEVSRGDLLIRQGDMADDLFFIESGRVTAYLKLGDGSQVRLRSMLAGTIIGEIGLYIGLRRTASVVADQACVVHRLTGDALRRMDEEQPALVAQFHKFVAQRLAYRLADTTQVLHDLLM